MLPMSLGRRTQVVKGEVCKTSMQRFESARRLHLLLHFPPVFCQALAFFCQPFKVLIRFTLCHPLKGSQQPRLQRYGQRTAPPV